jgi:NAD(P)H-dependent FMN reductase
VTVTAQKVVGLGGSLRESSRSRAALAVALEGARAAGATVELLDLRELGLAMYSPDLEADPPPAVGMLIETCYDADGMLWSSPMYNGSVSGSFKNAIDWLHMLGSREPPYLHDEVIGLISAAGGTQGLQVVNTMEFSMRSLQRVGGALRGLGAAGDTGLRRIRRGPRRASRAATAPTRRGGRARR